MSDPIIVDVMSPSPPSSIDDVARQQIRQWLRTTGLTQVSFAEQIERNQEWVSRYLNGNFDADLTTLQRMAGVFGHNLATLFGNLPSNPEETQLITMFRSLRPAARRAVVGLLQEWTRPRNRSTPR